MDKIEQLEIEFDSDYYYFNNSLIYDYDESKYVKNNGYYDLYYIDNKENMIKSIFYKFEDEVPPKQIKHTLNLTFNQLNNKILYDCFLPKSFSFFRIKEYYKDKFDNNYIHIVISGKKDYVYNILLKSDIILNNIDIKEEILTTSDKSLGIDYIKDFFFNLVNKYTTFLEKDNIEYKFSSNYFNEQQYLKEYYYVTVEEKCENKKNLYKYYIHVLDNVKKITIKNYNESNYSFLYIGFSIIIFILVVKLFFK